MPYYTHQFRVRKKKWREGCSVDEDRVYTDEELAFLRAIDRYKRENQRPYPSWNEVLMIFKSLGYEKVSILEVKEVI